ncbi:Helitron helicase [Phytophthora megakarya]|uniref:Helitron helicase n=1 Tax=Phytophthora megakarya TaxID=4795 RepID=A0A225VSJ3_9STRA|nr:Helitron helicase [Phytophthora megakarya]
MRVPRMTGEGTAMETPSFADFLLRVGEGRNKGCLQRGEDYSKIPQDMFLSTENGQDKASALIDNVYDGLGERYLEDGYFADRAILTPLNTRTFVSVDTVEEAQGSDTSTFPEEFLNFLSISGMPPHDQDPEKRPRAHVGAYELRGIQRSHYTQLNLKVGALIILLRNINGESSLYNGTRLQVCHMHDHYIEAKVLTGILTGKVVVISRISLISHNSGLPFELRRRQFPVQLAFAMTINKAQGQTPKELGVYLPQPVFVHGQLYVAL